jgi:hypothetical protein
MLFDSFRLFLMILTMVSFENFWTFWSKFFCLNKYNKKHNLIEFYPSDNASMVIAIIYLDINNVVTISLCFSKSLITTQKNHYSTQWTLFQKAETMFFIVNLRNEYIFLFRFYLKWSKEKIARVILSVRIRTLWI